MAEVAGAGIDRIADDPAWRGRAHVEALDRTRSDSDAHVEGRRAGMEKRSPVFTDR